MMPHIFILDIFDAPVFIISWVLIMMFSVSLHELGHAVAAHYEGDDTAKNLGYFTLNPMTHMGPVSIIVLLVFGICWGACPITKRNFKRRYSDAIVSFAGPLVNLVLAVSFVIFMYVLESFFSLQIQVEGSMMAMVYTFCWVGSWANAGAFLFNMLPVPPLDGHAVLADFFPALIPVYQKIGNGGLIMLFLIFSLPFISFWGIASEMAQGMLNLLRVTL